MSRHCAALVLFIAIFGQVGLFALNPDSSVPSPDEFVVAFNALDVEFDPHHSIYASEAQVFTGIYEGLFTYNPSTLEPVKSACKSYTKSKDGLTYTFYIREEAAWSDGSPLLAKDFRDAWIRAITPSTKADYASFFDIIAGAKNYRLGKSKDPKSIGISIVDDKILQVKLENPAAYFTRLLCHHSFSPIHPSMLKAANWAGSIPYPVNGPYRFESYKSGELVLVKNEHYWDSGSIAIRRIKMIFTDDDDAVTRRFDSGEIHWLAGPMNIEALLDRGAIQVTAMFGTQYWYFNCRESPWNKPELRRALALLLPWKEIRNDEAYYMPAPTLVLPFDGYDQAKGIVEGDEKEAANLLEKAGYPKGEGLPPIVILVPADSDDAARVSSIMKKAWEGLSGVTVKLETIGNDEYAARLRSVQSAGDFTLGLQTWIGDFADPLAFLAMFASDSNLNDAHFSDPQFDKLLEDAAGKDGNDRLETLAKAETRLLEIGAVLPLYHSLAANVVDTDYVEGWYSNALDMHPFRYLAFGQRNIRPNVAILLPAHP